MWSEVVPNIYYMRQRSQGVTDNCEVLSYRRKLKSAVTSMENNQMITSSMPEDAVKAYYYVFAAASGIDEVIIWQICKSFVNSVYWRSM